LKVLPVKDRDRSIEIHEALDTVVMNITARLNAMGVGTDEVMEALQDVLLARWKLYDDDPDATLDTWALFLADAT
jgi:hypothetical protein